MVAELVAVQREANKISIARCVADPMVQLERERFGQQETVVILEDHVGGSHTVQWPILVKSHFVPGAAFGDVNEVEHFSLLCFRVHKHECRISTRRPGTWLTHSRADRRSLGSTPLVERSLLSNGEELPQ